MASPARPAAASVSGAFGLSPDPKRCSFDQALRQKVTTTRRRSARDLRVPPCCLGLVAGELGVLTEGFRVRVVTGLLVGKVGRCPLGGAVRVQLGASF